MIAVGCVADSRSPYLDQALRLVQSWRWFAGSCSDAPFHVCVVEDVTAEWRGRYERLGAAVRVVPRVSENHPPSNKLRFLQTPEARAADHVLLLDCDTIVVQDPGALFQDHPFAAKVADVATVPIPTFVSLFREFGLRMPVADQHCTVSGEATIPYFNAGVLSFNRRGMELLVPKWTSLNQELIDNLQWLEMSANFCEQASLSLALATTQTPFLALGNDLNFPMHFDGINMPPHAEGDLRDSPLGQVDPTIIHYHWMVEPDGTLSPSIYPMVDRRVQEFNRRLLEHRASE